MSQRLMFDEPVEVDETATDSDSYCTPPEVAEPEREAAGGVIAFDPWTNHYAISHGWINAQRAWTLADGQRPGEVRRDGTLKIPEDSLPWPIVEGDFVHGNPPYSDPLPYVLRFIYEVERAGAWGMLLLKSDNRTAWAKALLDRKQPILMWQGAISFFLAGVRVTGNNFASTLYVVDGTGTSMAHRADMLTPIFEGKAWVYR